MCSKKRRLCYALGILAIGAPLLLTAPVGAENSTTIDQSTQPNLKSWSNIIPNANRRFVVLADFNNQAVLDRETGLVWEKTPEITPGTWNGAQHNCINKAVGGRKGWRLPAIVELTSLLDPSVQPPGPLLPAGHPFSNIQMTLYWSATTFAFNSSNAWFVDFHDGHVEAFDKTNMNVFWCVRGGMNAEVY